MKITPFCAVCLVPIHLTSKRRITNPRSNNSKPADKAIAKYGGSDIKKVFLLNTERDKNAMDARYSKNKDKENYVLTLNNQRISSKRQCLYFWYSTTIENICMCNSSKVTVCVFNTV
jgi:hypothetical protein